MRYYLYSYWPRYGRPLICHTPDGIRKAVCTEWGWIRATDCTHPLQNMNITSYVQEWEYENKSDEINFPPRLNIAYVNLDEPALKITSQKKWWQFWK